MDIESVATETAVGDVTSSDAVIVESVEETAELELSSSELSIDSEPSKEAADTEGNDIDASKVPEAEKYIPTLRESVSSLLFVSLRPLSSFQLSELLEADAEEIESLLFQLKLEMQALGLGYELLEVSGSWQFRTRPQLANVVTKMVPARARRLSRASAETLAVIAYKQPVPRSEIEAIRGVDALPTLKTLLDARLIRIIGRDDTPGQPALYGTTSVFLEKYGLKDLAELPTVREIVELTEEPGEIENEENSPSEPDEAREV